MKNFLILLYLLPIVFVGSMQVANSKNDGNNSKKEWEKLCFYKGRLIGDWRDIDVASQNRKRLIDHEMSYERGDFLLPSFYENGIVWFVAQCGNGDQLKFFPATEYIVNRTIYDDYAERYNRNITH